METILSVLAFILVVLALFGAAALVVVLTHLSDRD